MRRSFYRLQCSCALRDARKLKTRNPVVPLKAKNYVFAQPTPIAEIKFCGWTDDGNLRHASYKGLREIQDIAAVHELDDRSNKPKIFLAGS
ncbi:hypothetical protein thsrh120_61730 [Rhizobium sp. No.120]